MTLRFIIRLGVPFVFMIQTSYAQEVTLPRSGSHNLQDNGFLNSATGTEIDLAPATADAQMRNEGNASYFGIDPQENIASSKRKTMKVTPFIGGNVTYSDNINLTNKNKKSGMIYGIGGGVRTDYATNRLDAAGTAAANIGWDNVNHNTSIMPYIEGAATAELLRNHLYVDGIASYNSAFNRAGSVVTASGASNDDIEGYGTLSVSPYWRQKIGNWAVGELRYSHDRSFGTSDDLGAMQSNSYQATLGTADRFKRVSLKGRAAYIDSEFDDPLDIGNGDMQQTTFDLTGSYGVTRTLAMLGMVGYDKVRSPSIADDKFSSAAWGVGAEYRPNQRFRAMGMYGRRFNGQNYVIDTNYQLSKQVYIGANAMTSLLPPSGYSQGVKKLTGSQYESVVKTAQDKKVSLADALRQKYNLEGASATKVGNDYIVVGAAQNTAPYTTEAVALYAGTNMGQLAAMAAVGQEKRDFQNTFDEDAFSAVGNIGYDWTKKWNTSLEAFYYSLDTANLQDKADMFGGGLTASYAITDYARAYASLRRTERDAAVEDNNFVEHSATVGVNASF